MLRPKLWLTIPTALLVFARLANGQVLGQPTTNDISLASRCTNPNARFNFLNSGGFSMYGPAGIAIDPRGRLFVTDYGGRRVLSWPNVDALGTCASADSLVTGLAGPEAVAYDPSSEMLFVADTLNHTVIGYVHLTDPGVNNGGTWRKTVTLGTPGAPGNAQNQFNFPRGIAFDSTGRLFVADDYNNRILMFDPPFVDTQWAADSIGAGANGGFSSPKALAISGQTLFVADFNNNRVLRFTGPFLTPDQVYVASGIFTGMNHPIDLTTHPDGSLLVTDQGNRRIARFPDAVSIDTAINPQPLNVTADLHAEPLGIATDRTGRIFVADYQAFRVVIRAAPILTTTVNLNASPAARALLADLYARPGRIAARTAIGQQLKSYDYGDRFDPNSWYGAWLKLSQAGLPLPKIMGAELSDLMAYPGFYPNQNALNELIQHGRAGNIVTLVWHPDNPTGGAFDQPISTDDLRNLLDIRTQTGQNWQTQIDRAAAVLRQFQSAGVPVLFRPLHEQNGTFFWWGHDGSSGADLRARQAAWIAIWRNLVTQLSQNRRLDNLVFVFGANQMDYAQEAAPLTYYPGGNWADAVSIDVYNDDLNLAGDSRGIQHYTALIGTGKPFGLAEFGQSMNSAQGPNASAWDARTLPTRIQDSYPRLAFAIAWYSSDDGGLLALPDVSNTPQLLRNSLIQTQ